MSPSEERSGGVPAWAVVVGVVVIALILLRILGSFRGSDRPLDPRSDERLGTSALVALVEEMGGEVTISDRLPDFDAGADTSAGGPDVIVLFADVLDDDQRTVLTDWVAGGGRLVVTDPGSEFTPEWDATFQEVSDLGPAPTIEGRCDIDVLDGIDIAGVEPRNGGVLYRTGGNDEGCIGDGFGDFIVATDRSDGTVVALGGSGMLVNEALAQGENAPVVTALVVPEEGTRVLVLEPGRIAGAGGGDRTLIELIHPAVKRAFWQLVIAFLAYAIWRARRLGRPVSEPQPVAVAGSELVAAVGNLLDRTGSTDHAAALLRTDLRRFLANHLGVPVDTPPEVFAAVAAERTGVDPQALEWALGSQPVGDDAALVALADTIDRIREEVLAHA